jgi:hypothetical protein
VSQQHDGPINKLREKNMNKRRLAVVKLAKLIVYILFINARHHQLCKHDAFLLMKPMN